MSSTARVEAQAKINLRLKVLGLGDSGYHSIETVFLRVDLADAVTVATYHGGGIAVDVSGHPSLIIASGPADQNLALKAAAAYCERAGWHPRVEIRIDKVIPVGAGLGGGSADAAAVLRALDALAPSPLPGSELLSLAASIGSDVSFLVGPHAMAVGWGRGERLMSLPPLPPRPLVLAIPPVHVSTRDAYGWLGRARGEAPTPPNISGDAFASWERAARHAENDFSDAVAQRHPVIRKIRDSLLERGARIAMLTGSGSAVFGVFDSEPPDAGGPRDGEWQEIRTVTAAHVVPLERMD
ncbi:MAG: 4-(cytidine 5'-diphospho)-2-C-methyl-D-erythritol kinase [Gemmatimonadaceae bacterium]